MALTGKGIDRKGKSVRAIRGPQRPTRRTAGLGAALLTAGVLPATGAGPAAAVPVAQVPPLAFVVVDLAPGIHAATVTASATGKPGRIAFSTTEAGLMVCQMSAVSNAQVRIGWLGPRGSGVAEVEICAEAGKPTVVEADTGSGPVVMTTSVTGIGGNFTTPGIGTFLAP